ncbi:MAG: efflux RND transporter periplasmic adaptor subunit [Anaeromicrobium sp.]|uniref:efflux RND transporter periplasmic adaptor subunit n=1 Tax=Anaeromicrobium sp. TaxID=1929132 RepID=UPI0025ED34FB|nr:efflux RND transporter periplasmic adaptor subunit [Anaeromicrobium sp.]MCT4593702.1 efflux RND transporter periplasmic adaptor subunit [Anaeromicrobium sp.]
MFRKKKLLTIVVIAVVVGLVGMGTVVATKKNNEGKGMGVSTVDIRKENIESRIQATGKIQSMDKRDIVSDVEEKMEKMYVKKGDLVEQGQVLMELEKTHINYKLKEANMKLDIAYRNLEQLKSDLNVRFKNAEIKYNDAQINYERNKKLYEAKGLSKSEYDKAKNELDTAQNDYVSVKEKYGNGENGRDILKEKKEIELLQVQIEKLEDDYKKHTIKSPIRGTIVDTKISESGIVESHIPLMFIQDVDNLEIVTDINEYDAGKIDVGYEVKIEGDAFEDKSYDGVIKYVGPFAKEVQTGQGKENVVEIKVDIKNIDKYLKPGFSAKLDILTKKKENALVVPYETIFTRKDGSEVVYTVVDGKVQENIIKTGIESDLEVEIIGDTIKEGDKVIMNPTEDIKVGEEVNMGGEM